MGVGSDVVLLLSLSSKAPKSGKWTLLSAAGIEIFPFNDHCKMADDVSDDICDSWEDMIENGVLEKKLEELKVKSVDATKNGIAPQMKLEDATRTQYVITVPRVKILKRPSDAKAGHNATSEKSPTKQPLKTLEQREAEYAEARLRILGSARHVEFSENSLKIVNSDAPIGTRNNLAEKSVIRQPNGPDGTRGFRRDR